MNEIPMIKNTIGVEIPDQTHYRMCSNGLFMAMRTDWVDAVVPVTDFLQHQKPEAALKIPLPGKDIFLPVLRFFHAIYQLYYAEAAILLHFNMNETKWSITIPEQEVSASFVHYDMTDRLPGYRCVGTMHSHARIAASHSGVDRRDESVFDGLHVTLGDIHKFPRFDMDAELFVRGYPFKVKPESFPNVVANRDFVLNEVTQDEIDEPVSMDWINKVKSNWTPVKDDKKPWFLP